MFTFSLFSVVAFVATADPEHQELVYLPVGTPIILFVILAINKETKVFLVLSVIALIVLMLIEKWFSVVCAESKN